MKGGREDGKKNSFLGVTFGQETGLSGKKLMKVHTDPDAWKGSFNLAVQVYNAVRGFPVEEKYCLGAQVRRAARGCFKFCVNADCV